MDESILISIKKVLGIDEDDSSFDTDIIMHINSVFGILWQLGVGPIEGFEIEDEGTTWNEFLPDRKYLNTVKSYMAMKVRKVFDPPQSSSVLEALEKSINEYEWRINVMVDPNSLHCI